MLRSPFSLDMDRKIPIVPMQMMSFMSFIDDKIIDFNHSLFLSFFTKKVVILLAFQLFSRGNKKYFF